jgi:hypothetical protein
MAIAVYTLTQIGRTNVIGNQKQKFYTLTSDTGTYTTGGQTFTASQFGLKKFRKINADPVTGGTAGATINWLGWRYNTERTSVTMQVYESAATGLPGLEKTSDEANVANFSTTLEVVGH